MTRRTLPLRADRRRPASSDEWPRASSAAWCTVGVPADRGAGGGAELKGTSTRAGGGGDRSHAAGGRIARAGGSRRGCLPGGPASHPVVHSCHAGRALCGSIRVPLYWSLPDGGGRRLQVRFRVYLHTDAGAKAAEPVVAFEGGPGYGSIGSAGSYLALLGPLRAAHDLIVMDQRGTGTSDPIHCPALQQGPGTSWTPSPRARASWGRPPTRTGARPSPRTSTRPVRPRHLEGRRLRRLVRHLRGPGVHAAPPRGRARDGARRRIRQLVRPVRTAGRGRVARYVEVRVCPGPPVWQHL